MTVKNRAGTARHEFIRNPKSSRSRRTCRKFFTVIRNLLYWDSYVISDQNLNYFLVFWDCLILHTYTLVSSSFPDDFSRLCVWRVKSGDRAVSKHSDRLSNDFMRCDWLNRYCFRFRTVTVTQCRRFPTHTKTILIPLLILYAILLILSFQSCPGTW